MRYCETISSRPTTFIEAREKCVRLEHTTLCCALVLASRSSSSRLLRSWPPRTFHSRPRGLVGAFRARRVRRDGRRDGRRVGRRGAGGAASPRGDGAHPRRGRRGGVPRRHHRDGDLHAPRPPPRVDGLRALPRHAGHAPRERSPDGFERERPVPVVSRAPRALGARGASSRARVVDPLRRVGGSSRGLVRRHPRRRHGPPLRPRLRPRVVRARTRRRRRVPPRRRRCHPPRRDRRPPSHPRPTRAPLRPRPTRLRLLRLPPPRRRARRGHRRRPGFPRSPRGRPPRPPRPRARRGR